MNEDNDTLDFTLWMFDDLLTTIPRRNSYDHFIARSPSQTTNWASADNRTHMMFIASFTHAEDVGMLQDDLQDQECGGISINAAERIVLLMGALPLKIFQLGSCLKTKDSSAEEFIRWYQKPSKAARVDPWYEATPLVAPLTYQHTLATAWRLAFETLAGIKNFGACILSNMGHFDEASGCSRIVSVPKRRRWSSYVQREPSNHWR
ncbi:MAG: hypothetical protein Q9211_004834 [Gyalolechia sp. 1 TL-2023]